MRMKIHFKVLLKENLQKLLHLKNKLCKWRWCQMQWEWIVIWEWILMSHNRLVSAVPCKAKTKVWVWWWHVLLLKWNNLQWELLLRHMIVLSTHSRSMVLGHFQTLKWFCNTFHQQLRETTWEIWLINQPKNKLF